MTIMTILPHPSRRAVMPLVFAAAVAVASCSPEKLVGNAPLPPDVPDPAQTRTPAGALAAYRGAILLFRTAVGGDPSSMIPSATGQSLGAAHR